MKITGFLPLLLILPACAYSSDFEKALASENIAVQQITPAPRAPGIQRVMSDYRDYYDTLSYYSEAAYRAEPGTDAYLEAYIAGNYLRNKVDAMGDGLRAAGAQVPDMSHAPAVQAPSKRVLAELRGTFGFGGSPNKAEPVSIKQGFAKIVYVKGTTPYLVQEDSFLKKGEVILTFDDGPAPGEYSKEVAENLRANSASAVFFVLGQKLGTAGKAVIKDMSEKGQVVSVHGYFHATESGKPFTAYSKEKILSQLGGVADTITAATGDKPGLFRPPYGVIAPDALKSVITDLNLVPLGWTIDTLDWSIKSPEELYAKTIAMIKQRGKGVILMHDIHPQSRETAKRLLNWLKENNYTVVAPDRITQAFKAL